MADPAPWYSLTAEAALARAQSRATGLTSAEAAARLAQSGPNELAEQGHVPAWRLLLAQLKNVLTLILLGAAALSLAVGHGLEAAVIAVIVLFSVLLGFVQEYRAGRAIESLRRLAAPHADLLRDGAEKKVPAREVVAGDIALLHAGDHVPADARLLEAFNLTVEESALTGESLPVEKQAEALDAAQGALPVGDRTNLVHAGTTVAYGRGKALVVATGMDTEFGGIARLLTTVVTPQTPLQRNLDRLGTVLAKGALGIIVVVVAVGLLRGQPFLEMLLFGVALAVAVVPEALPAVVTISLALGLQRMARRHALIRWLPAVETLGSTSVICTDKTGTLTKDEMTVRKLWTGGALFDLSGAGYQPVGALTEKGVPAQPTAPLRALLEAGVLASDATLAKSDRGEWTVHGDPTEGALVVAAAKLGLAQSALVAASPRVGEVPFSAERRSMATLHQTAGGRRFVLVKGAPGAVLECCSEVLGAQGPVVLDGPGRAAALAVAKDLAGSALRVLAIARRLDGSLEEAGFGLTLLGLVGMIDPPRPEAAAALRSCEAAGIRAVMITGDHPDTAAAVARELGLLKQGKVASGADLDGWDEQRLAAEIEGVEVFARVSPAHKLRVVTALQARGHTVAMTGDGVNDAPALRKADIGIAMGITGTDVARDAAAMTLTDDGFASIVAAVEEGRRVFGNIKKYLMYLLSSNIGEIGLVAGATLLGLPLPLGAVQLLYVNLATDGLPALALAVDPPDEDLMSRPPRDARKGLFTRPVVTLMIVSGLWSTLVNTGLFAWALRSGRQPGEASSMTFTLLVLIQFFNAYNFRSDRRSALHRPFANKWLNFAIGWEVLLLLSIVNVPFLQRLFATTSLSPLDWVVVVAGAASIVPVVEAAKGMERRGWFGSID